MASLGRAFLFGGGWIALQRAFEEGHADGHAVVHLLRDGRLRAVGDFGGDLHTANDGAGVHDHRFWRVRGDAFGVGLVATAVVVEVDLQAGEALGLNAQHHDDLGAAQGCIEVAFDDDAWTQSSCGLGQQFGRTAEDDFGAEAREEQCVRTRDTAVQNIAADGERDALKEIVFHCRRRNAEELEDGPQIEQRLGGVFEPCRRRH